MTETIVEAATTPHSQESMEHKLRKEAHNMLRDVAFVLAQTQRLCTEVISPKSKSRSTKRAKEAQ